MQKGQSPQGPALLPIFSDFLIIRILLNFTGIRFYGTYIFVSVLTLIGSPPIDISVTLKYNSARLLKPFRIQFSFTCAACITAYGI